MAGDFVVIQFATARKIEVLRIAAALGVTRAHAFGLCVETWIWFDEQTEDGVAKGATCDMLDAIVGVSGFAQALSNVGWLRVRESSLELPNFDRLMGRSAKKRINDTIRQRNSRGGRPSEVDDGKEDRDDEKADARQGVTLSQTAVTPVTKCCDESVTLQNRTEQKINTTHSHTREGPEASPLRTWRYPQNATEGIYPAIDRWQAYLAEKGGRPAGEVALESLVKLARDNGWDDDKIDRSVTFSVAKGSRSWLDPDCDFQAAPLNGKAPRPKVDLRGVKF